MIKLNNKPTTAIPALLSWLRITTDIQSSFVACDSWNDINSCSLHKYIHPWLAVATIVRACKGTMGIDPKEF